MANIIQKWLQKFIKSIFNKKKDIRLGLYGPPNAGKTTLANRISLDWIGEEMGSVSHVPHETREVQIKEQITIKSGRKELTFNLVDTPGIATRIDYEDFLKPE
jgi:GTPase